MLCAPYWTLCRGYRPALPLPILLHLPIPSLPFLWAACSQISDNCEDVFPYPESFQKLHVLPTKMCARSPFRTWLQSSECFLLSILKYGCSLSTENKVDVCKVPKSWREEAAATCCIEGNMARNRGLYHTHTFFRAGTTPRALSVFIYKRGLVVRIQQNEVVMKMESN